MGGNLIFDRYDRIRIVNLAARRDRRVEMQAQLAKVGLREDRRVEFFEALSFEDPGPFRRKGSHGAFRSHLSLLRDAAEAGHSILILQDDCNFIMPDVLTYEQSECDIFYGGYFARKPDKLFESDIIGAHFMGFSSRAAKAASEYLSEYLKPDFAPDPRANLGEIYDSNVRPPIDGALVWFRRTHPHLKSEFAMLSYQRSSPTDIGDRKWPDRYPILRRPAAYARKFMRYFRKGPSRGYVFDDR